MVIMTSSTSVYDAEISFDIFLFLFFLLLMQISIIIWFSFAHKQDKICISLVLSGL